MNLCYVPSLSLLQKQLSMMNQANKDAFANIEEYMPFVASCHRGWASTVTLIQLISVMNSAS